MKKIYALLLLTSTLSFGQTIFYEGFNYSVPGNIGGSTTTATDAVGSNNWFTHSNTATTGVGTIDVITGNLNYSGIAPSTGKKVLLPGANTTAPRDINSGFTTTATTIYYSFLINVVDNTQLTAGPITGTNNYFMCLGGTSGISVTSLFGRVAITSSGTGYRLSISNVSTGTLTYTENPVDLAFGTTNLVVVKYDRSASPTVATLWVNPTSLGGVEPTSTLTNNSGTSTVTAFGSVVLRNSSATPKAEIDEIKVGLTYADVTSLVLKTSQNEIAGLKVYPNPVSNGVLHIESNLNTERTISLFDVLGKQVISTTTSNTAINIATLKSGVYIVKITEAGKTATRKLVVE
jgi:hypothetical protein